MRRFLAPASLGSILMLSLVGFAGASGIGGNPADAPYLLRKPLEAPRYDEAKRCQGGERRGVTALGNWLDEHFRGESWGSNRCERWGPGSFSIHAEGRALDWHLDARKGADRRSASRLIGLLLQRDSNGEQTALARRMGVQGLIWNCRQWFAGMTGLDRYSYCFRADGKRRPHLNRTEAHMDHVHIELNWPGARMRTSFWRWVRR